MFCHLNYHPDIEVLRNYFVNNKHRAKVHRGLGYTFDFWLKLFDKPESVKKIINDLGLNDMDVRPRFSFQEKNTLLPKHIDIDRIVGINFNLLEKGQATIHINDIEHTYESALIDVGAQPHSVEPVPHDRLVLKLAIRNPWEDIYEQLEKRNMIKTLPPLDYKSEISLENEKYLENKTEKS